MTTLTIVAIALFVIYCFMTEWNCSAKHSPVIVTILCRLVARHIKLALKLLVGLIYFFGAISTVLLMQKKPGADTPQGHLASFVDRVTTPVQLVVDGIIGFLGLVAMGALLGSLTLLKHILLHPRLYGAVAFIVYLFWLGVTICDLVEDEVVSDWTYTVSEDHGGEVAHRVLTKEDHIFWSALTFALWIALLFSAPHAFGFLSQKFAIRDSQASAPPSCVGQMSEPICQLGSDLNLAFDRIDQRLQTTL